MGNRVSFIDIPGVTKTLFAAVPDFHTNTHQSRREPIFGTTKPIVPKPSIYQKNHVPKLS